MVVPADHPSSELLDTAIFLVIAPANHNGYASSLPQVHDRETVVLGVHHSFGQTHVEYHWVGSWENGAVGKHSFKRQLPVDSQRTIAGRVCMINDDYIDHIIESQS